MFCALLPPPKEVMYVFTSVSLSVCLITESVVNGFYEMSWRGRRVQFR